MRYDWLQVPNDMLRARAITLSALLTEATGRKVTRADALTLVLDLWDWVVSQVNESAEDRAAEFHRCTRLPKAKADLLLPGVLAWPAKHVAALLTALCDPHVHVMEDEGDYVRVTEIEKRYAQLAKNQADSRLRARLSYLTKRYGWKHVKGTGYVHETTGEVVTSGRELLERLEAA